ncbi:MAG TPA: CHAT domain-containing protein [Thermoanaerobaculia bacterium]|nr:CHAT domain-containing protein [Thermoanaerobaculia bacterium]
MAAGRIVDLGGPRELTPGLSLTRPIDLREAHVYRARLAAGDALRVRVDQGGDEDGLDLAVELSDPTGTSLTMDGLNGGRFPEELAWVARTAGDHLVTVRPVSSVGGRYRLDILRLAPGSPDDSKREEALRLDQQVAVLNPSQQIALRGPALRLWRDLGDRGREAQELYLLGTAYWALDDTENAAARLRESAAAWGQAGVPIEQGRAFNDLGRALSQARRLEEARRAFDASLAVARRIGDRPLQVYGLHNRGALLADLGETESALRDLRHSLALSRELDDAGETAKLLLDLGFAYRRQGRYDEAIRSCEAGLRELAGARRQVKYRQTIEAALHNQLGGLFNDLGDWEQSIAHYEGALAISRHFEDLDKVAATLNNLALVLHKSRDFRRAFILYQQALDTGKLKPSDQAKALNNMAFLEIEMGDPGQALELSERAIPLAAEPDTQAAILEAHGLARLKLGDLDLARQDLQRARAISASHHLRSRQASLTVGLGRVAQAGGDLPAALGHCREAVGLVESLRTGTRDETLRALLLASRRNPYDLCVETLVELDRLQPGRGYDAESLRVNELGRARSLLDLLDAAGGPSQAAPSRSLAQIQSEVLAPGAVLLEYALGETRSYLWAVTQDSLEIHPLPPRQKIEEVAAAYSEKLRARILRPEAGLADWKAADRQADALGARLSELILAPVAGRLRGARTVLVVSDGALQYIPIAALPAPDTGARMVEEHAVVHLPSASVLASLRQEFARREPAARTLAVFYDPVFERADERFGRPGPLERFFPGRQAVLRQAAGPHYPRLLASQDEAESILPLVPPAQAFSAHGFEASVERVRRAPLDQYRFLHFATHGVIDSVHPERSSLIFSQYDAQGRQIEGRLSLADIYNLRLNADCVVLSACDTALGREIRGEGLIGFTRAFLDAGSRRVLASLWSIDDKVTARLMGRFYRSMLVDGNSPAMALREAQIEMLKNERSSAPYFWAGFSLQGEWR